MPGTHKSRALLSDDGQSESRQSLSAFHTQHISYEWYRVLSKALVTLPVALLSARPFRRYRLCGQHSPLWYGERALAVGSRQAVQSITTERFSCVFHQDRKPVIEVKQLHVLAVVHLL